MMGYQTLQGRPQVTHQGYRATGEWVLEWASGRSGAWR